MININKILLPEKVATFEMEGFAGFEVDLCFVSKDKLKDLTQRYTTHKWDARTKTSVQKLDEDEFFRAYVTTVIRGWRGLKGKYLVKLMLVDLPESAMEEEVPFNEENAEALLKNSKDFDTWVSAQLEDVQNFTKKSTQKSDNASKTTSETPTRRVET